MKIVTDDIRTYYKYNGKLYKASFRKTLRINDVFLDCRDYDVKIIDSEQDIIEMSYVAPELYIILEEITTQN